MERAERLYRQGEYDGAWLEIEELQPIERVMPEPVDLRLRICIATGLDLADSLVLVSTPVWEEPNGLFEKLALLVGIPALIYGAILHYNCWCALPVRS